MSFSAPEGALRFVAYHRNPANLGHPIRRVTADVTPSDVRGLRKARNLQGAFRVDVERVEVEHWSLVARRFPKQFIDLGYTKEDA